MVKRLPNSDESYFVLCEDVREEVGNKISFMGVFVNNDILVPKNTPKIVLASLAFVFVARGGDGDISEYVSLIDPSGATVFEAPKQTVHLEAGRSHPMIAKMAGRVMVLGVYTVNFHFDDKVISHQFEVKET